MLESLIRKSFVDPDTSDGLIYIWKQRSFHSLIHSVGFGKGHGHDTKQSRNEERRLKSAVTDPGGGEKGLQRGDAASCVTNIG